VPQKSSGRSLAQQLARTFAVIGTLVGAVFVAAAMANVLVIAFLQPELEEWRMAGRSARAAHAAMLDEETGLRGYLLTRDPVFLEPYDRGKASLLQANEELIAHAVAMPALADHVLRTRVAEERWNERWAEPAAATMRLSDGPSTASGKELFDAYRAQQSALSHDIDQGVDTVARRERETLDACVAIELALFLAVLLVALQQRALLHGAVVAPVALLLRDIARVRDGDLQPGGLRSGPLELRQLGEGLDDMVGSLAIARSTAEAREVQVREHSARLRQILDASREFSESLNLGYVVRTVRESTKAVSGYDSVVVWLMADDQKRLCTFSGEKTEVEVDPVSVDIGVGLVGRAAKLGRLTYESDDGKFRLTEGTSALVRAIAIPLVVGARVVGTLEARCIQSRMITTESLEVLETLATHAATAVESARLYQLTEERSQMDALTRLFNRRRLDDDLKAECERSARYGRPLAFVMLDVDHFKAFNDAHGHPQADVALQEIARILMSEVRSTDSSYRYGGEEFCILLRETNAGEAMALAERLRKRIEASFASSALSPVTASFGVTQFSTDARSPGAVIEAADAAMYQAKRSGRNRVMLAALPDVTQALPAAAIQSVGNRKQAFTS
jgi:diguanylate cyclase (GGDEF)-like protein